MNDNWRSIGGFFPTNAPGVGGGPDARQPGPVHHRNDGRVYTMVVIQGQDWSGVNDSWRSIGGFLPRGPSGRGGPDAGQPRRVRHRERRAGVHDVVVRRGRLVGGERQLALDRWVLPPARR